MQRRIVNWTVCMAIGQGVERDWKKAKHYMELASMKENVDARHQLGCVEGQAGNEYRAMKRFIAASAGDQKSLDKVCIVFMQ